MTDTDQIRLTGPVVAASQSRSERYEAFRGAGAPKTAPLELGRGRLELTLDLPAGSEPGDYDVQLTQGPSQPVAMASARAELVDGVTVLKVRIDLREARLGPSSLLYATQARAGLTTLYFLGETHDGAF
jgi:hypothetical protein